MSSRRPPLCSAVAGYGLPGVRSSWPVTPLDERDWMRLLSCVKDQRLSGFAMQALEDGVLLATDEQRHEVAVIHRWWMGAALKLEQMLLRTIGVLEAAEVDYRILKGTAVAHLDYPDPSLRCFGDVDILVPADQFDAAVTVLTGLGHRRRYPEPRPGFDRRFGKGAALLTPDRLELDLHRTFAMGPFGLRVQLADLWSQPATFRLASRDVRALPTEERFLHACFHAALGDPIPRLTPLRDVAQMMSCRPLDLDVVRELTSRWRAEPVVGRAVAEAARTFDLGDCNPLVFWAQRYRQGRAERRAMTVYVDQRQSYAAKAVASLAGIPSVRQKAAYIAALAFPQKQYMESRHRSRFRRWRRGVAQILRKRRL